MVMEYFTKWAEAFPIRDHKVQTVVKILLHNVFSRFGMAEELLIDQGPEFGGELFLELCKALDIRKIRTSPYRTSINGMIERFHRTLNQMLGKVVNENQRDWDVHVSAAGRV